MVWKPFQWTGWSMCLMICLKWSNWPWSASMDLSYLEITNWLYTVHGIDIRTSGRYSIEQLSTFNWKCQIEQMNFHHNWYWPMSGFRKYVWGLFFKSFPGQIYCIRIRMRAGIYGKMCSWAQGISWRHSPRGILRAQGHVLPYIPT